MEVDMTRYMFLLAIGCATQDATEMPLWESEAVGTLPPPSLTLEHTDVIAGSDVLFTVTGANPREQVALLYGAPAPGAGPCPDFLDGDCLSVSGPIRVLAATRADSAGALNVSRMVPSGFDPGTTFGFQAVSVDGGYSELREAEVLSLSLVEDFSLVDMNATSPTVGEPVSPRDYLAKVSGWYFGHAT